MGSKKNKKAKRSTPVGYDGFMPTKTGNATFDANSDSGKALVEKMKRDPQVGQAINDLKAQIQEIKDQRPSIPEPPLRHDYQNEIWKEHDTDPHEVWLKITCSRCAFLVYAKAGELREKVLGLSAYCAMPFATASEAEIVVRRWEATVAEAYAAIEPAERDRIAKAIKGESVVADDRAGRLPHNFGMPDEDGIVWKENPGYGGPLDGNVIARGFKVGPEES